MGYPEDRPYRDCEHCGHSVYRDFACQWRFCPSRIGLYFGDQAQVLKVNLAAWEDRPVTMFSITAGGANTRAGQWDSARCSVKGPHRHSGRLGCRVLRFEAACWNATAPERWGKLRDAVYSRTRHALKRDAAAFEMRSRRPPNAAATSNSHTPPWLHFAPGAAPSLAPQRT
jgi:hypothetical protein